MENSWQYAENQGGDRGVIVSYDYKSITGSIGSIRNSYGDSSNVITVGYKKSFKSIDIIASVGISDGYKRFYYYKPVFNYPEFFVRNNAVPVALITSRIKVFRSIGVQINVSPAYVNYGLFVKI